MHLKTGIGTDCFTLIPNNHKQLIGTIIKGLSQIDNMENVCLHLVLKEGFVADQQM